ncbi:SDR family oxidoreductase [bacterium]|nr:SDR family oxidoreductase [bacterium]
MARKVALITGSNRGIGFETALGLGQKGMHILLGVRNQKLGKSALVALKNRGVSAELVKLDLSSDDSILKAVQQIKRKYKKLDVLVNNAGVLLEPWTTPPSQASYQKIKQTFKTNFFGVILLTQKLLPLLKKSSQGRIVNVSSIASSLTLLQKTNSEIYGWNVLGYSASKTALNALTVHLAYELKGTKIKVNAAHPGWVRTRMGTAKGPVDVATGAKTSIRLATLPANGPSGKLFHMNKVLPW